MKFIGSTKATFTNGALFADRRWIFTRNWNGPLSDEVTGSLLAAIYTTILFLRTHRSKARFRMFSPGFRQPCPPVLILDFG